MKPLFEGANSKGQPIMVDLNDVRLNPAGTNMTVATYPDVEVNRGNTKPIYEGYKSLKLLPADKETVQDLFNLKVAEQAAAKKAKEKKVSNCKKNTARKISA